MDTSCDTVVSLFDVTNISATDEKGCWDDPTTDRSIYQNSHPDANSAASHVSFVAEAGHTYRVVISTYSETCPCDYAWNILQFCTVCTHVRRNSCLQVSPLRHFPRSQKWHA